jgi:hypothetical protein
LQQIEKWLPYKGSPLIYRATIVAANIVNKDMLEKKGKP